MYRTKLFTGIVIYAYSFDEGYSVTYMFIHVRILRLNKVLSKNEEIDKVRELTAEYFLCLFDKVHSDGRIGVT